MAKYQYPFWLWWYNNIMFPYDCYNRKIHVFDVVSSSNWNVTSTMSTLIIMVFLLHNLFSSSDSSTQISSSKHMEYNLLNLSYRSTLHNVYKYYIYYVSIYRTVNTSIAFPVVSPITNHNDFLLSVDYVSSVQSMFSSSKEFK